MARADKEEVAFVVVGDNQIYKFEVNSEGQLIRPKEKCDFGLGGR